jgi:hypothetical protein
VLKVGQEIVADVPQVVTLQGQQISRRNCSMDKYAPEEFGWIVR